MCVFVLFVPSWFYKCVYDNQSAEWDMKQHWMDVKWKQWQAQLKITSSEWDEAEWDAAQETGNKQKVWLCLVYSLAVNILMITRTGCSLAKEHKNVPFAQFHTSSMLLHLWQQCVSQALNKSDFCENRFQHKMWKTETVRGGQMVGMWECCSLGCRLGGEAWKRPCHGLPLVESGQCPSNHPAPTLSSLPSVNRAGDAVTASLKSACAYVCRPKPHENAEYFFQQSNSLQSRYSPMQMWVRTAPPRGTLILQQLKNDNYCMSAF